MVLELSGVTILHSLQMLAVESQLSWHFENFVGNFHHAQSQTKHHCACHKTLAEDTLFFCEDIIGNIGMHIKHDRIEQHALAFRNCAPDGTRTLADLEVLIQPVL